MSFRLISPEIGNIPSLKAAVAKFVLRGGKAKNSPIHWILKVDVSGSMSAALNTVKRDVNGFAASLGDDDIISVVAFSGHGESYVVAAAIRCTKAGKEQLERKISAMRTLSTTVFSEGLQHVIQIASKLTGDIRHQLILFSDGLPVPTSWSHREEVRRSLALASDFAARGGVFSAIGYTNYYDPEFLANLVESGGNAGVMRHIENITAFGPVISEIRQTGNKTVSAQFNLRVILETGEAFDGSAFRTTPQIAKVGTADQMLFRDAVDGEVTLFVALPLGTTSFTLAGTIDGKPVSFKADCKQMSAETRISALWVGAAYAFMQNDRDRASELLEEAGQSGMAERVREAYSTRELLSFGDELRRSLVDAGVQQKYGKKKLFIGKGETPCVANLLRLLVTNEGCTIFIPEGSYERTGMAVKEKGVTRKEGGRLKVTRVNSHKERYNLSVTTIAEVYQQVNGVMQPSERFRAFVILKDGSLHLPMLQGFLTENVYDMLVEWGVVTPTRAGFSPTKIYDLNLGVIPTVVKSWASPKKLGLVDLLAEIMTLEGQQTAINRRIKELRAAAASAGDGTKPVIYRTPAAEATDFYSAPSFVYELKGFTPPPAPNYAAIATLQDAEERGKEIRKRLAQARFVSRLILMAMDSTGNKAFKDVTATPVKRSTTGKMEQIIPASDVSDNPTYAGCTLRRITWTETVPYSPYEDAQEELAEAA